MNDTATLEPEVLPVSTDVTLIKRADLPAAWEPFRIKLEALKKTAETLQVTDVSQTLEMKLARTTRLELRQLRIEIEKCRKGLGEDLLRQTQKINGTAKEMRDILEALEARLEDQEKFAERAEATRILDLSNARTAALNEVGGVIPANVGTLAEEEFQRMLADAALLKKAKEEEAARLEQERLAKIEADRLERQRIEEENAKLKAEAEETARLAKIESDRIAKEREAEQRKAREESEKRQAEFAAERAKAEEAARIERDKVELARREAEAEATKARKEAQEAQAKIDAAAAKEAAERKAEATLKANAAKAPDKDKLQNLLCEIKALTMPTMATDEGKAALEKVKQVMNRAYSEVKAITETL